MENGKLTILLFQLPADIEWHVIGHLQSNKVKSLLGILLPSLEVELVWLLQAHLMTFI